MGASAASKTLSEWRVTSSIHIYHNNCSQTIAFAPNGAKEEARRENRRFHCSQCSDVDDGVNINSYQIFVIGLFFGIQQRRWTARNRFVSHGMRMTHSTCGFKYQIRLILSVFAKSTIRFCPSRSASLLLVALGWVTPPHVSTPNNGFI
jgi:hypothetical protein